MASEEIQLHVCFEQSGTTTFPVDGALRQFRFSVSATVDKLSIRLQDTTTSEYWQTQELALFDFATPQTAIPQANSTDYAQHIVECLAPTTRDPHTTRLLSHATADELRVLCVGFPIQVLAHATTLEYTFTLFPGNHQQSSQLKADQEEQIGRLSSHIQELTRQNQALRDQLRQSTSRFDALQRAHCDVEMENEALREQVMILTQENRDIHHDFKGHTTSMVEPVHRPLVQARPTSRVFFDIAINRTGIGRLVFELFVDQVPRTAENFRALCTGEKGRGLSHKALHLKGSRFYKATTKFACNGGDFDKNDGSGGESIYGPTFKDESFRVSHDQRGLLSMVNAGPHTNNSKFRISFGPAEWLNGKSVVFGRTVSGDHVLTKIEKESTSFGKILKEVEIVDCGEITS